MADELNPISFVYEKSSQCRTISGAGMTTLGYTPAGLSFAFFTEHPPIPQKVVHSRKADGTISSEPERTESTQDVIIRETECVVTMNLEAVKSAVNVLKQVIDQIEQQVGVAQKQQVKQ